MIFMMEPEFNDLKDPVIAYMAIQAAMERWGEDYFDQVDHMFSDEILSEFLDYLIDRNCITTQDKEEIMKSEYRELLNIQDLLTDRYVEEETRENWEAVRDKSTHIIDKIYYYFANYICKKDTKTLLIFQDTIFEADAGRWSRESWLFWSNEYYMMKNTQFMEEIIE